MKWRGTGGYGRPESHEYVPIVVFAAHDGFGNFADSHNIRAGKDQLLLQIFRRSRGVSAACSAHVVPPGSVAVNVRR